MNNLLLYIVSNRFYVCVWHEWFFTWCVMYVIHDMILCTGIDLCIYIFWWILPGIWSDARSMILLGPCGSQLTASWRYCSWYYCKRLRVCRPFHHISWGERSTRSVQAGVPFDLCLFFRLCPVNSCTQILEASWLRCGVMGFLFNYIVIDSLLCYEYCYFFVL